MPNLKITIHLEVDFKTSPDAEIIGIKEDFANYCERFGDVRMVEVEEDKPTATNLNKIMMLTTESLADLLAQDNCCQFCKLDGTQLCSNTSCKQGILQYLESEVTE